MKIMFSAGESSGDLHGAKLATEIKKLSSTAELVGFGGDNMAAAGVDLWQNCQSYNIMGVAEVVANLGRILRLLNDLTERMAVERPDTLVLIDYPDFNWRLAKRAKKLHIPVFSYIPPSAWAWRRSRAKDCAAVAGEFAAIFPFELEPYRAAGANISFWGNPLTDTVKMSMTGGDARRYFGVTETEPTVLLMPGSRRQEIERIFLPMLHAAEIMRKFKPQTKFFVPVAAGMDERLLTDKISQTSLDVRLVREHRYDLMGIADFAVATSGTVVLEAALLSLPCVVLYKMSRLNYFIGKLLVHVDNISLPNILLGRRALPELLQDDVEPNKIAAAAMKFYRGTEERSRAIKDLQAACHLLGEPGAAFRIAERILKFAEQNKNK